MNTKKETFATQNKDRKIIVTVFETDKQILFKIESYPPGFIHDGPDLDSLLDQAMGPYDSDKRRLVITCNGQSAVVRNLDDTHALFAIGPSKGKGGAS